MNKPSAIPSTDETFTDPSASNPESIKRGSFE
jgi:hypothetical protein